MSALSLRLPNSLHKKLSDLARRERVSINQLVNSAVADLINGMASARRLWYTGGDKTLGGQRWNILLVSIYTSTYHNWLC